MDAEGRAPAATDPNQGTEPRTGGRIPALVSEVSRRGEGRSLTPDLEADSMPIAPSNPFKGRHFPGEVILLSVRWYLRYPLAYDHVAELLAERGVAVDPSCVWRWV